MKLRYLVFLCFIPFLIVPATAQPKPGKIWNADGPYQLTNPAVIRPFGDSITFGVGYAWSWPEYNYPPYPIGGGYRAFMTKYSFERKDKLLFSTVGYQSGGSNLQQWLLNTQNHDGYPGWTTKQMMLTAEYISVADITLVHAGTNDIWHWAAKQKKDGEDPGEDADEIGEEVADSLFEVIEVLLEKNEKTHIFLAKIIQTANYFELNEYMNPGIRELNSNILKKWINLEPDVRKRITIINMESLLNPSPVGGDYFYNKKNPSLSGVHPNASGYAKIACAWIHAIQGGTQIPSEPCDGLLDEDDIEDLQPSSEQRKRLLPLIEATRRLSEKGD